MSEQQADYFYPRKLVLMAIGFGAGIALGKLLLGPFAYAVILLGLLFALLSHLFQFKYAALILLMFALGLFRLGLAYPSLPAPSASCELTGKVALPPEYKAANIKVVLRDAACNGYPVDGRVLLTLKNSANRQRLSCGDTIRTTASLALPQGPRNFGGMDMRFYYFTKGIVATAFSNTGVCFIEPGKKSILDRILELREKSTSTLVALIGAENGALAASMLHGGTQSMTPNVLSDFRTAGIAHLLAVSGLHVGLLIGALLFLLRRFSLKLQFTAAACFLIIYSIYTAFSEATVRASIMALSFLLSELLLRRPDSLSSLALAFLLILAVSPFSLFSAGFQLSFSAVLGLLLLYPPIKALLLSLPEPAADALSVSVSASISTMPVSAAHFKSLPMLAVFANLLAVPLASLAILPAFGALLIYPVLPKTAAFAASITGVTLNMMRTVAALASKPGSLTIAAPSLGACLMFFCSSAFVSKYFRGAKKEKRLLFAFAAILSVLLWVLPPLLRPAEFLTMLDLPSGYALHLRENGRDMLFGTSEALKSSQTQYYIEALCLKNYETVCTEDENTELLFKRKKVYVAHGKVICEGERYALERTGQLTLFYKQNRLYVCAYALDERYAILYENPKPRMNLEGIWTMHTSTNSLQKAR